MKLFGQALELAILDVDGVIVNSMRQYKIGLTAAANVMNVRADHIDHYLSGTLFHSLEETVKFLWPELNEEQAIKCSLAFREAEKAEPCCEIAGSVETIRWFKSNGLKVAICTTNSLDSLNFRLDSIGLSAYGFDAISHNGHEHVKPDPRSLTRILDELGVSRDNAVFVGDWLNDLEAARDANIRFLAVENQQIPRQKFRELGVPYSHILSSLSDIRRLIQ